MKKKVILFHGKHCGTCKSVSKNIHDRIDNKPNHIDFQEVSIDEGEGRKMAVQFHISSLPTAIVFDGDVPAKTLIGSSIFSKLVADHLI